MFQLSGFYYSAFWGLGLFAESRTSGPVFSY